MSDNPLHNVLSAAVNRAIADGAPVYVNVPPVHARYHFRRVCSYMGTIEYEIRDDAGTYRAELRTRLCDYERSILNYRPDEIAPEIESTIGMLRRCVCDNRGEVDAATLAAFNAWRAAEHDSWLSRMRAEPERYGTDFSDFPPPVPAFAGFWEKGKGWTRALQ
ncbi:hypothetical protein [Mesorhizobium silamurunense]|uniref:hypothetical protein n=1 Tax=Mesorhizobium silamurunense TaxID=499528 RepID=UPI0017802E90|nr:hypothetical protein [Mesorhizobium silamurunense]